MPDDPGLEPDALELARLRRENLALRETLASIRASESYRIGHAIVRLARRVTGRRARSAARGRSEAASSPADAQAVAPTGSDATPAPDAAPAGRRGRRGAPVTLDASAVPVERVPGVVASVRAQLPGRRLTVVHARASELELPGVDVQPAPGAGEPVGRRVVAVPAEEVVDLVVDVPRPLIQVVDEVDPAVAATLPPGPVFVGGTGRSGTWVLGRLFGSHPRWTTIRTELRFHASEPGFAAVLDGRLTPEDFAELVRTRWLRVSGGTGGPKGLQLIAGKHEVRADLNAFLDRAGDDLPGALGQLLLDVTGPWTRGRGALGWCETTPDNVAAAGALTTVLPTARIVHAVRDGRDVAASVVAQPWGPDDLDGALTWWAERLRAADAGARSVPADRVHTVRLEELVNADREAGFAALCDAVGFTEPGTLRRFFDRRMSAAAGNVGRWRRHLDTGTAAAFDRSYRDLVRQLEDEGVAALPAPPSLVDEIAADAGARPS